MSTRNPLLFLLLFGLLAGCSDEGGGADLTVIKRCPELDWEAISGTFGSLEGENNINSKYRILFERTGDGVQAKYVAGGSERFLLTGHSTGEETMVFVAVEPQDGKHRRLSLSMSPRCRLVASDAWASGPSPTAAAQGSIDGPSEYVAYDLQRLDFEPCTEVLSVGKAAQGKKPPAQLKHPAKPPVVTGSELTVAAWSKASELGPGCKAEIDLYAEGDAEAIEVPLDFGGGELIRWSHVYETRFLGKRRLFLHRVAQCGGKRTLLGVACADIEVK